VQLDGLFFGAGISNFDFQAEVFSALSALFQALGTEGYSMSDAIEPVTDRFGPANGSRPLRQYQESGLESILGIVFVAQNLPAHTEHHPSVPLDECPKGGLVMPERKILQQLTVGRSAGLGLADNAPQKPP
jgi:hypothetical protein